MEIGSDMPFGPMPPALAAAGISIIAIIITLKAIHSYIVNPIKRMAESFTSGADGDFRHILTACKLDKIKLR